MQQATTAHGDHRWSMMVEEEVGVLGEGLGEKKEEKWVFYAAGHICSLQDSPR